MYKNGIRVVSGIAVTGLIILFSCSKSNNGTDVPPPTGNGDSALVNISSTIIVPAYQALATSTASLDAAVAAFTQLPNNNTLAAAQGAFKAAYLAWENCSGFQFGPAADQLLVTNTINVFPTDSNVIKTNISTGSYTIDGIANVKAQGFPGIDFLLFNANNAVTLARYTTDGAAANAKKYLTDITASIKTKAAVVSKAWSDTYLAKFNAATGVDAGSSLSLLTNAFVQDYDVVLKNYKLGIPIGKYGPSVLPQAPAKVEAYYSGISLLLLVQQVKALQNVFTGGAGYGFDDKLTAVKAQKNGQPLKDVINAQFAALLARLAVLQDPLSSAITTNFSAVNDAYSEAGKLVVLIKVDLSSALGVKISFQDDDGD